VRIVLRDWGVGVSSFSYRSFIFFLRLVRREVGVNALMYDIDSTSRPSREEERGRKGYEI
jgi:hypothetical protein